MFKMKSIVKLYIKIFLITGISFGLLEIGFDFLSGDGFALWKFVYLTLAFGTTMSLIMVSHHKFEVQKRVSNELTDENLKVSQKSELFSKVSKTEFITRLQKDKVLNRMKLNEIENGVELIAGFTWKSWGEIVEVRINELSQNEYIYKIASRPKLKTTLVDYGKNLENIQTIQKILKDVA